MDIRTSYFAQLKKVKELDGAVPIAICAYPPKWYDGLEYSELAPSYEIMMGLKTPETRDFFMVKYGTYVLANLSKTKVRNDIENLVKESGGKFAVLMCFEKSGDFCHRHIVAAWLGLDYHKAELSF